MNLSIVLPTYNRREIVMSALRELEPLIKECEIVVVDDSTDGTSEAIRARYGETLKLIHNESRKGALASANVGILAAKNDMILLLNDDCHIVGDPLDFATSLTRRASNAEMIGLRLIDMVSPKFDHAIVGKISWWMAGQIFPPTSERSGYVDFVAAFAFDKSKISVLFDANFPQGAFNAESDFQLRARKQGAKLYYDAGLTLIHNEISSSNVDSTSKMLANHEYFLKKHFPRSWWVKQLLYRLYLRARNWYL